MSENPEIEIDLIYQLLRMAVNPTEKELQAIICFLKQEAAKNQ
jgi:preprotein translocase subunit Sss1